MASFGRYFADDKLKRTKTKKKNEQNKKRCIMYRYGHDRIETLSVSNVYFELFID